MIAFASDLEGFCRRTGNVLIHSESKKGISIAQIKKGLKPIIKVIDVVPINDWVFWETYWIAQFKSWGFKLINYTNGGDGATFGNQTSFKKGNIPWNNDKSFSQETKDKISASLLGVKINLYVLLYKWI